MIIHNINPILIQIGPLKIYYYSLVYIFGIIITYFILLKLIKQNKIKNLDKTKLDSLLVYIIIGLILGARILDFVFYSPSTFITDPLEILKVWHGGMSFHGGLIGLIIAALLFCKKYKIKFYDLADIVVIPGAITLFLGRIANFINGELIGTPSNLPFCIKYKNIPDCRHPSQIYESGKNLIMFFTLIYLHTKKKLKSGFLFWLFILMYGSLRFIITFLREDIRYLGLSTGQYLSLIMVIIAIIYLQKLSKKPSHHDPTVSKDQHLSNQEHHKHHNNFPPK